MTSATMTTTAPNAPDTCPTCGAGELLFTEKRRQFRCGGAAVLVGGASAWNQNWPCILPRKDESSTDGAELGLRTSARSIPTLPVVGPVASLEVVEGTPDEPRHVRIAFVGSIGDWHELHAWSKSGRTAEDHIRRTLQQAGRPALPMTGVGAAA